MLNFIKDRKVLFGAVLFGMMLTYKTWAYAIAGLRNKEIIVWGGNTAIIKLKGRKATYFALFWLAIAILLTLVIIRFIYLLVLNLNPYSWH